jgi:hypothetical protein
MCVIVHRDVIDRICCCKGAAWGLLGSYFFCALCPMLQNGWLHLGYDSDNRVPELTASARETDRGFSSDAVFPLLAIDLWEHACGSGD